MSGCLKCCGILDLATDIYLACYGSWEKYFSLSNTRHVVSPCEFQHPQNGEGKAWMYEVGTVPKAGCQEAPELWTAEAKESPGSNLHCISPVSSATLYDPVLKHFPPGQGSNDLQLGQNTKRMGSFTKNNTIFKQDIWMEDNCFGFTAVSAQPKAAAEGGHQKWRSLLWPHPALQLVILA